MDIFVVPNSIWLQIKLWYVLVDIAMICNIDGETQTVSIILRVSDFVHALFFLQKAQKHGRFWRCYY